MLDFCIRGVREDKRGLVVYPKFTLQKVPRDLMIKGGDFYAVWDEANGRWTTSEFDLIRIIDDHLKEWTAEVSKENPNANVRTNFMWDVENHMIDGWHKFVGGQTRDFFEPLDDELVFANDPIRMEQHASKRLPYALQEGPTPAWNKIVGTLYSATERHKIEWAIGSIVSGDSRELQKFMVLYGSAGTGKSTILNIIEQLFEGYCCTFDAKALGSASSPFALEAFRNNPLVGIQHDGDLSRIEDNTRLNSLVSHEYMQVNEKFKQTYASRFKAFLFMGTNSPVKITDGKSGILRRLIDVSPSGEKLDICEYNDCMARVKFELGAIAYHCKEVYLQDKHYYDAYIPVNMMSASNDMYNFMSENYATFVKEDSVTLTNAWTMYKAYVEDARVSYPLNKTKFKEELKSYFKEFHQKYQLPSGSTVNNYYCGFKIKIFTEFEKPVRTQTQKNPRLENSWIHFKEQESIFDAECANCPAQYATKNETPIKPWDNVTETLSTLDTRRLHYVRVPENHIVIDFDLKNKEHEKDINLNLEAASTWPETYAEVSKGGQGIHLHYIYDGDVSKLSAIFDENIEVKVFRGKTSLRRKLSLCNDIPIAHINSGLPFKEESAVVNNDIVRTEKGIRTTILKCLNKEVHANTRPNIDMIFKVLDEAYKSGLVYDVSDLKNDVIAFAAQSSNQAAYCLKRVQEMHFMSDISTDNIEADDDRPIVFYDIEVFPNLFLVNWKYQGNDNIVRMINPSPTDIAELVKLKLVGFNNREYDNHILYGRMLGYSNEELYELSKNIVSAKKGEPSRKFREAYHLSYTDIYDFAAKKQSLKKWEIELGIYHDELGLPWDKPVPEELWGRVSEYCDNDVKATEAVFDHLKGDFTARKILAELSGLTANDKTNDHTTRIIFGKEKHPKLVYTHLDTGMAEDDTGLHEHNNNYIQAFPEYKFENGHNMYRGTDLGFGGYVYAEPGMYTNVALLDIASLHPHSTIAMNCFGEYTQRYKDILDARMYIKHKDFDKARTMLDGKLAPYLDDESTAKQLAQALKIAINSVYGLTSASFPNPFRDNRNVNNIVALRGALFMRTLQDEVVKRGFKVAHIKTDSIKIPNATQEIIDFCMEFAKQYGYTFEHEATYERMCLVNDAVYIAKYADGEHKFDLSTGETLKTPWTATGTQFQVPYVFKTLFSKDEIKFADKCETKSVSTALYLSSAEKGVEVEQPKPEDLSFIGKVGLFCPIKPECGGKELLRQGVDKNGNLKYSSATGAKGYRWLEAEMVKVLGKEDDIDISYYTKLVDAAKDSISNYGDFEWFVSDCSECSLDEAILDIPWKSSCGANTCFGCPKLLNDPYGVSCADGHDVSDIAALLEDSNDFAKR